MSEAAFEVLTAIEGFARLEKRSPLLDGAVPLRVAQGCVPLLEGNAFGFQVVLDAPVRVRRGLLGLTAELEGEARERLEHARRAALPRLEAQGFLPAQGAWARRLRDRLFWTERGVLRLWTGLLVRPAAGVWLRVSAAANRRNWLLDVRETHVGDHGAFVPLVLDLEPTGDSVTLRGEVACVAPIAPDVRVQEVPLEEETALGLAHADFYDAAYFAAKKGEVTKKYRKLVHHEPAPTSERTGSLRLSRTGPSPFEVEGVDRTLGPTSTEAVPCARRFEQVVFGNAVSFTADYDGHTLETVPDAAQLAAGAAAVEKRWAEVYGPDSVTRDRRALWYLTKYFTPHPPGEPHFFVKPWAFTRTPPGWSSLVEGIHGPGYDVLRGVVSTDQFHATPAVFQLHGPRRIAVRHGAPLVRVQAIPRWLLRAGWKAASWRDAAEGATP